MDEEKRGAAKGAEANYAQKHKEKKKKKNEKKKVEEML